VLETIDRNTNRVRVFQAVSRRQAMTDWYTVAGNNSFVRTLSIVMCVVIIVTSLFQVYFVRRLFNVHGTGVKSSSKPRA
jgi:p24 family protein gamma-5